MSIERRLSALEESAGRAETFPGWSMLGIPNAPGEWFAEHGHADALAAWEAGVRGPWLDLLALRTWLHRHGHASFAGAWAADAVPPAGLGGELRRQALVEMYHAAGRRIGGAPPEMIAEWREVGRWVAREPTQEILGRAAALLLALSAADQPRETDDV